MWAKSFCFFSSSSSLPLGGRGKELEGGWEVRSMVVLGDRSVVWIQIKQINSRRGVLKPKHSLRASWFSERFCFRCETPPPPPPRKSPLKPLLLPSILSAGASRLYLLFLLLLLLASLQMFTWGDGSGFLLPPNPLSKDPPTKTHI